MVFAAAMLIGFLVLFVFFVLRFVLGRSFRLGFVLEDFLQLLIVQVVVAPFLFNESERHIC